MSASKDKIYLSVCQGSEDLGQELANILKIKIAPRNFEKFSSGEILLDLIEDPASKEVYILSTPLYPGSEGYMELFLLMDAAKRHGAEKITPIIPYFGYGRQNRCFKPYSPLPCELLARLLKAAGATDLITLDLHDLEVLDFFTVIVTHLSCSSLIAHDILNRFGPDVVIVSPDEGGIERAQGVANILQSPTAMIQKKRMNPHEVKILGLDGNVAGKITIIIDDLVDSGNTICRAAELLREKGATAIHAYVTHDVLSEEGVKRIQGSVLSSLTLSNSVPTQHKAEKIRYFSLAPLLAEAIRNAQSQ